MKIKSEAEHIFNFALERLESCQPWENYFRLRRKEFEMILHFFKPEDLHTVLELGCGQAFTSSLLSAYAEVIVASDLPKEDILISAKGMEPAVRLTSALKVDNVHLVGSSLTDIPIKSGRADLVFSQYVLEHIPFSLRSKAVKEMKGALSETGVIIALVPNFLDRIYNYPYYYVDLCIRLLAIFKERLFNSRKGQEKKRQEPAEVKLRRLIFPPIHGNYQSRLHEITKQFPFVWERLFTENGLRIVKTFTIKHSPLATKSAVRLYEKTAWITKITGGVAPFKYLGDCYCIVAKKL